ncbi:hypothetical protein Tco_0002720 [Tanacetum coccineum]
MWLRIKRLMQGTKLSEVDRETRFNNNFDQFTAELGESLVSVFKRFSHLMNDLKRNKIHLPTVTINTNFLNYLQPKWYKYVTNVRLAKDLTKNPYDELFDRLQQYEKLVIASQAKKLEKTHDPLALVAYTSSSSRSSLAYYVRHPPSIIDYDDEYQEDTFQNNSKDPLNSAMMLLARAITQRYSTPINNRLRSSSNTRNQAVVQADRVNIQSRNVGNDGRIARRSYNVQEESAAGSNVQNKTRNPRVRDSKYFMEQMLLANKDEARVILSNEQNDFLLVDVAQMEELKEFSANICMMSRIQPANIASNEGPSYNYAFISEVEVNSGSVEHDKNDHDNELEQLARNAYKEAEKQQIIAQKARIQSQKEINELIENVNQKTYAYGDVREQNQDLLTTIFELKAKLKTVERDITSVRRPSSRSSSSKNSALSNNKNHSDNVEVHVRTNKKTNVAPKKNVVKKKIVTNVDVKNALKAKEVIQIIMWIVVSGCSNHMTGDLKLLKNFVEKFIGTIRFGNDHFAAITGYGDYVRGNIIIYHEYYVECLGYNLFSVGKFCDGDLGVAFLSKTCYFRNLEGDDLLKCAHDSNLYTISISDMVVFLPFV